MKVEITQQNIVNEFLYIHRLYFPQVTPDRYQQTFVHNVTADRPCSGEPFTLFNHIQPRRTLICTKYLDTTPDEWLLLRRVLLHSAFRTCLRTSASCSSYDGKWNSVVALQMEANSAQASQPSLHFRCFFNYRLPINTGQVQFSGMRKAANHSKNMDCNIRNLNRTNQPN